MRTRVLLLGVLTLWVATVRSGLAGSDICRASASGGGRRRSRVAIVRDNAVFRRLWLAQAISGIGDWVFPPAVYAALIGGRARASDLALLLIAQVGPGVPLPGGSRGGAHGYGVPRALAGAALSLEGGPELPRAIAA